MTLVQLSQVVDHTGFFFFTHLDLQLMDRNRQWGQRAGNQDGGEEAGVERASCAVRLWFLPYIMVPSLHSLEMSTYHHTILYPRSLCICILLYIIINR